MHLQEEGLGYSYYRQWEGQFHPHSPTSSLKITKTLYYTIYIYWKSVTVNSLLGKSMTVNIFSCPQPALYLPLLTHPLHDKWQIITFETWDSFDIWSEWCMEEKTKCKKNFILRWLYFGLPFQRRNQLGFRKLDVVAEYISNTKCASVWWLCIQFSLPTTCIWDKKKYTMALLFFF